MMNEPQSMMQHLINREFKIAAVCLYMSAKFEDPKYPFFNCYRSLLLQKTEGNPEFFE